MDETNFAISEIKNKELNFAEIFQQVRTGLLRIENTASVSRR